MAARMSIGVPALIEFEETAVALSYHHSSQEREHLEHTLFQQGSKICLAYPRQTIDERIDTIMAFEGKMTMVRQMHRFAQMCIDRAANALYLKDTAAAANAVRAGLIADVVLDGRGDVSVLEAMQDALIQQAERAGVNIETFIAPLVVETGEFLRRAWQARERERPTEAAALLERALAREPGIRNDPKYTERIAMLQGRSTRDARLATQEFMRVRLAEEAKAEAPKRTTTTVRAVRETETQEARKQRVETTDKALIGLLLGVFLLIVAFAAAVLIFNQVHVPLELNLADSATTTVIQAAALIIGGYALVAGLLHLLTGRALLEPRPSAKRPHVELKRGSPWRVMGLFMVAGGALALTSLVLMTPTATSLIGRMTAMDHIAAGIAFLIVGALVQWLFNAIGFGSTKMLHRR